MIHCKGLRVLAVAAALALAGAAHAAPVTRVQVDQRGDFVLIGNTLGQDCAVTTPLPNPATSTVATCGTNTADSSPDVYWRSDFPAAGAAVADLSITAAQARSSALLTLPPGATVTHAFLYWSATRAAGAGTQALLERNSVFSQPINALTSYVGLANGYVSVADVTSIVQTFGAGPFRVGNVASDSITGLNNPNTFVGWWMVVLYQLDSDPMRTLALREGLDSVVSGSPIATNVSGFLATNPVGLAKLGLVALDGDAVTTGDGLAVNGFPYSDLQNPVDNVFNSTHSYLGAAVQTVGDLPQTTGVAGSLSGLDIDVDDISAYINPMDTSLALSASTTSDVYHLATLVASIPTSRPDLASSFMNVTDLNGGALLPGDQLEYQATVHNTGNDTATLVVLADVLPAGVSYVPGSLVVANGANAGSKTDGAGDDQAEYDAPTRSIIMRLGSGANGTMGGVLVPGDATTVQFRVSIDPFCSGTTTFANTATLSATAQFSGQPVSAQTDGDTDTPGTQPTSVTVDVRCLTLGTSGAGSGSISVAPSGASCSSGSCSQPVPTNSLLALDAQPGANSTFNGWSGDASGTTTPVAVTLDVDRSVGALFRANEAITNFVASPSSPVFSGGGIFTVSADGGGSSQPVVFASLTPAVCQLTGSTAIIVAAGHCVLTADQAGDADYNAAPQLQLDVTITRASQAIGDFAASPAAPVFVPGGTFTVSATGGGSGQPLVFGSLTPGTCSVAGSTVTMLASGLCTVSANQAGDGNFDPAPQATLDVTLGPDDTIFRNGFDGV